MLDMNLKLHAVDISVYVPLNLKHFRLMVEWQMGAKLIFVTNVSLPLRDRPWVTTVVPGVPIEDHGHSWKVFPQLILAIGKFYDNLTLTSVFRES